MSLAGTLATLDQTAALERARQRVAANAADVHRTEAFISLGAEPDSISDGPLRGATFSVKDNIDAAGVTTTCGSRALERAAPARADADIVARLKRLGATYAGKANMHEFALGATGLNDRFGPMPNPWDRSRIVGGSSGGSVIAVARGLVDISVGTDSGGSVRMPAAFTGVAGFKPTPGLLPMDGVAGASWSIDCLGLATRTAEDMAYVWHALAPDQPPSRPRPRIAYLMDHSMGVVAAPVWEHYLRSIETLRRAGFDLAGVSIPGLEACPRICISIVYPEVASSHHELMRSSPELYEQDVRALIALGEIWSARNYIDAQRARTLIRARIQAAIETFDLLITPAVALQPPRFRETPSIEGDTTGSALFPLMRFTVPFNVASMPAMSVPSGLDDEGLPTGLQVVGRAGEDAGVVALCQSIEATLGVLPSPP